MPQTRGGKRSYAEVVKAPLPAAAEPGPSPRNPGGRPSSLLPLSRPDETVYAALVPRHMRFGLVLGGAHSRIALAIVEGTQNGIHWATERPSLRKVAPGKHPGGLGLPPARLQAGPEQEPEQEQELQQEQEQEQESD